jgi:hypothetical protein
MKHIHTFESFLNESILNEGSKPDFYSRLLSFAWLEFLVTKLAKGDYSQDDSKVKTLMSNSEIKAAIRKVQKDVNYNFEKIDFEEIIRMALAANSESDNGNGEYTFNGNTKHWAKGLEDYTENPMSSLQGFLSNFRRNKSSNEFQEQWNPTYGN